MKSLLILGRQPEIGIAELESLYGADAISVIGRGGVLLDREPSKVQFSRLGGSMKLAEVITTLPTNTWRDIEPQLHKHLQDILSSLPDGKIKLGLSTFGIKVSAREIGAAGLELKKQIKSSGRSVRVVPNKSSALNSAQVLHNQLTGDTGIELVIARHSDKTVIARTRAEQDIEAYARRDQGRPARDARVGMLPPKLAQIIINLAVGKSVDQLTILDPYCGTGVVLQEAYLMGYILYGTDIDNRMIEYSDKNLAWLQANPAAKLEVGDATKHRWSSFDTVACETYLGKPLTSLPSRNVLDAIMAECDDIHTKFLRNIGSQVASGTRFCLAVPAWRTKNGFLHLKTLDHLEELGYNRISFVHVQNSELIYHRPDQTVARELVVLTKR